MQSIKLTKEQKSEITGKIKNYFLKERDEEVGDLAAVLFLDFITKECAPYFYNQGVEDSIILIKDKVEDLYALEIR